MSRKKPVNLYRPNLYGVLGHVLPLSVSLYATVDYRQLLPHSGVVTGEHRGHGYCPLQILACLNLTLSSCQKILQYKA